MDDEVKLLCTFKDIDGEIKILSPILDLYTCNSGLFTSPNHPPNIMLNQNSNGDVPYNIYEYITSTETKIKCYWDTVKLNLWQNGVNLP